MGDTPEHIVDIISRVQWSSSNGINPLTANTDYIAYYNNGTMGFSAHYTHICQRPALNYL